MFRQFFVGILFGKLPFNVAFVLISLFSPNCYFQFQFCFALNSSSRALPIHCINFYFSHVQLASVFGSINESDSFEKPACFSFAECFNK